MAIHYKREALILLIGDAVLFFASLWLALFVRYGNAPSFEIFIQHGKPFLLLSVASIFVFLVAGLYENHTLVFRNRLPATLLNAQIANIVIAVSFFYFIPYFGITPKTILFIYLLISSMLTLAWRLYGINILGSGEKEGAILIGSGSEMKELKEEVNQNPRYSIRFIASVEPESLKAIDFQEEIVKKVYSDKVTLIGVDLHDSRIEPLIPHLYNLIFSGVQFVDMHRLYEDTFRRIPLSLVRDNWFLENISASSRMLYDGVKRLMDIAIALPLMIVTIILTPLVWIAIKLDDGGTLFISQERVGKNGKIICTYKFRSMARNETDLNSSSRNEVTRVGSFLRKTRIDEFPQLWSVLLGDMSLIGPRPELPSGVKLYKEQIPYYGVRHLIKPGLSGWAQIYHDNHPHHSADVSETKVKLSYDLYYIKNRSLFLDLKIAARTIQTLLSRKGI